MTQLSKHMRAIWEVVATVEFLKAKNNTQFIFHINVKVYICSFKWQYVQLILSRLYEVIAPCKDIPFSTIFDNFGIQKYLSRIYRRNHLCLASQ